MKKSAGFIGAGISVVSMIVWLLLPVLSFVFIIPLFSLNGLTLGNKLNQIMLIPIATMVLMLVGGLTGNRKLMQGAGILQILVSVLVLIFRKDILLGGNLKWLYSTARLLMDKVGSVAGFEVTSENLANVIDIIVDQFMQPGIGYILHMGCVLVYLVIAFVAPNEKTKTDPPFVSVNDDTDEPEIDTRPKNNSIRRI